MRSQKCSPKYTIQILSQQIICDCDGCKIFDGRLFTGCTSCEIRKCAIDNNLANCAYCSNYSCDKLNGHSELDPAAQAEQALQAAQAKQVAPAPGKNFEVISHILRTLSLRYDLSFTESSDSIYCIGLEHAM